jgi:hypothetical protein
MVPAATRTTRNGTAPHRMSDLAPRRFGTVLWGSHRPVTDLQGPARHRVRPDLAIHSPRDRWAGSPASRVRRAAGTEREPARVSRAAQADSAADDALQSVGGYLAG